jgi:hypothetical protein
MVSSDTPDRTGASPMDDGSNGAKQNDDYYSNRHINNTDCKEHNMIEAGRGLNHFSPRRSQSVHGNVILIRTGDNRSTNVQRDDSDEDIGCMEQNADGSTQRPLYGAKSNHEDEGVMMDVEDLSKEEEQHSVSSTHHQTYMSHQRTMQSSPFVHSNNASCIHGDTLLQAPLSSINNGLVQAYCIIDPLHQIIFFPRQIISCVIGSRIERCYYGPFTVSLASMATQRSDPHMIYPYDDEMRKIACVTPDVETED